MERATDSEAPAPDGAPPTERPQRQPRVPRRAPERLHGPGPRMRRRMALVLGSAVALAALGLTIVVVLLARGGPEALPGLSDERAQELVATYVRARNGPDLSLLAEIYSPDVVVHDVGASEPIRGLDDLEARWVNTHLAFPDFHLELEDVQSEGPYVIARWRMTGTNTGPLEQIAATGRAINVPGVTLVRVEQGRIMEEWVYWDTWELYRQLGFSLVPPEPALS